MPKLIKQRNGNYLLFYSYLEDLAVNRLHGVNKQRDKRKRLILNKIIKFTNK